jgi:hypothetical protein
MAQVKVTSIDALESFRARLILFINKAGCSVGEVIDEVNRTRYWIQNDQRMLWEREFRRRTKVLEQAEQELMSARLSGLKQTTSMQQNAVNKAKKALQEAEEKRRVIKKWNRDYNAQADPLAKKLESLRGFLDHDLPKAVSYLSNAQKTLESYVQSGQVSGPSDGAPAPGEPEAAPESEPSNPTL